VECGIEKTSKYIKGRKTLIWQESKHRDRALGCLTCTSLQVYVQQSSNQPRAIVQTLESGFIQIPTRNKDRGLCISRSIHHSL